MKRPLRTLVLTLPLLAPSVALAAARPQNFADFVHHLTRLLNLTIPIAFAIALLAFFWGLVKFIYLSSESDSAREDAKNIMLYGVLALFVMLSVWGFVRILQETIFGTSGILP